MTFPEAVSDKKPKVKEVDEEKRRRRDRSRSRDRRDKEPFFSWCQTDFVRGQAH